ncbi:hypothetical protein [Serratia microhaemolytica]|uniref:hypothetical protein n=1 Tax=Serratia microhaemolytica TaxID=2675110 RepID=UPI00197EFAAE|nr:hypothetical protein [Serratia microhaemolytica]
MSDERIDYYEIRSSFLECCYEGCRVKLNNIARGSSGLPKSDDGMGYASYQYEGVYQLPVERLMLEVVHLILMAARGPENVEAYHRNEINKIFSEHPLDELIQDIGEEERKELLRDMKLLKLL